MRRRGLEREVTAEFFEPQIQAAVELLVRADRDPMILAASVRSLIRSTDPIGTVSVPTTLDDRMSALGAGRRFETALLTMFAIVALILAAVGIYGVLRYTVVERRREIAVRSALGATPMAILRLIVGDSLRPAAAGVGSGSWHRSC
jgi:predicted lysophospholipase L1 biosynthesis ABC-type transport system permease subunit